MDQLFLKMAFAEIFSMEDLPVKVSMNEYIEISKYYGAAKSKLFVNGLLDNVVKTYTREGKIKKIDMIKTSDPKFKKVFNFNNATYNMNVNTVNIQYTL